MSVFTQNIPQPGDNPSFSQDQLLQNNLTLNAVYGTNGDHYAWTNVNASEQAKHAKVTMPGLPTATAPGNALPTPAAGNDAIFSLTRNGQTTPFLTRDGLVAVAPAPPAPLVNIWPLMPLKAYASITLIGGVGVATVNDSYNINTTTDPPTVTGDGGAFAKVTFTLINPMRTAVYGVLATSAGAGNFIYYEVLDNMHFVIHGFLKTSGASITASTIES